MTGADRLDGGQQWDALVGNDGDDRLFGRGAGVWFGNMGDDRIEIAYPDGAETRVRCGGGDDVLIFNEPYDDVSIKGCETVKSSPPAHPREEAAVGRDRRAALRTADAVERLGTGDRRHVGGDELNGTREGDTIAAYGGDDESGLGRERPGPGRDRRRHGVWRQGPRRAEGGDGPNRLVGGINRDLLRGGDGPDQLSGRGRGVLAGNAGDDVLEIDYPAGARTKVRCGAGDDILYVNGDDEGMSVRGCETVSHVEPD